MSDIHVDNLNNSQLILLVLLISLVVSAATAVATLSVVYERLALTAGDRAEAQPTVIRQTINRIIEREPMLPAEETAATGTQTTPSAAANTLTLDTIERSLVRLYFGSQPFTDGMYISPDGHILAAEVLDKQRRYSVLNEAGQPTFFSPIYNGKKYSLLAPVDDTASSTQHYVPLKRDTDILLGQAVVLFSGAGDRAQLHTGIVSQKRKTAGEVTSFRTSVNASNITTTSAVFIENTFAGFAEPYSDWVTVPDDILITNAVRVTQTQTATKNTESTTAKPPQ